MDNNEIFDGKTFEDLTRDIYENQKNKKLQLDLLIQEIHGMIQTMDDAVLITPLIKELFEVAIKNDEDGMLLSETEKEDLIAALQDDVSDIQQRADKIKQESSSSKGKGFEA